MPVVLINTPVETQLGWYVSILLATIMNACENKDASSRHTFSDGRAERILQMEGAQISERRFQFGIGTSLAVSQN